MKPFSKLYSDFWIHPDNTELMQLGIDAKLMALYLQGNSHHNMLGVYYLPILYVASDLKQSVKKAQSALKKLCDISYCKYDERTQYIWVCNMAITQLGEDINANDNRIKAIQAIWNSLPIKIEFLSEVYDKYYKIFNLTSRFTDSLYHQAKNNTSAKTLMFTDISEAHQNKNISASTISTDVNASNNLKKEPSVDGHHPSTFPTINSSLNLTSSFEGVMYVYKEPLQGLPMAENTYNFNETNISTSLSTSLPKEVTQKDCFSTMHHPAALDGIQILANKVGNKNEEITPDPLQEVTNFFDTTSKGLPSPFEAPSKDLQSPSKAPSDPLPVEYRIKNIENRNKKEEVDLENIEKKRKDLNLSNVLIPNIVVQARPQPEISNTEIIYPKIKNKSNNSANSHDVSDVMTAAFDSDNAPDAMAKSDAVALVFEHWKNIMQHQKSNLDRKRRDLIRKALDMGYSVEQLCDAITGCSITPHNRGQNDRGQRYDGLHIILRDADQIDRFVYNCHHPPKITTEAHQRLQGNISEINEWLKNKKEKFHEPIESSRSNYV